jgi:hypothetical protein
MTEWANYDASSQRAPAFANHKPARTSPRRPRGCLNH